MYIPIPVQSKITPYPLQAPLYPTSVLKLDSDSPEGAASASGHGLGSPASCRMAPAGLVAVEQGSCFAGLDGRSLVDSY